MPKYELKVDKYFYCNIYYYLNHPYGVERKVLKNLEPNILMFTELFICNQIPLQHGQQNFSNC